MRINRSKKGTLRLYLAIALLVLINIGIIGGCIIIKRYRFDSFTEKDFTVYVGQEFTLDSIMAQMSGQSREQKPYPPDASHPAPKASHPTSTQGPIASPKR